ncbi:MAG: CPBP family intramembrane metalloprotease [Balneolales bacterium]|nr:CPBP family intramembrane metalloprotease [Balneolales bacterium]
MSIPEKHEQDPPVNRREMLHIAMVSALMWMVLGSIIIWLMPDADTAGIIAAGEPLAVQLTVGLVSGLLLGYAGVSLMKVEALRKISDSFTVVRIIKKAKLTNKDAFFISLSAGISEEWLFRAALIPLAGITIASVLFVVVHGYIKFSSGAHLVFAGFMLLLSFALGLLFLYQGIFAAMIAHTVYDVAAFYGIRKQIESSQND